MDIAVLMSVYNRRETTLACLAACYAQIESLRAGSRYSFRIYLTDDGSTDGTSDAVQSTFPDVRIIYGDGTLFWNRGMCAAWKEAAQDSPDFYLWLNDDTMLLPGAFSTMLEISSALRDKAIVVGTAKGKSGGLTYGGRTRSGRLIPPDRTIPVGCDIFNGNLVLVPEYVYSKIGPLDPFYTHSFGDYDYGVRADKAGIVSVVAPGILAVCDRNPGLPVWRDASYSLRQRYAALSGPKGRPFREQFVYDFRSEGIVKAILHFLSLNLKVIFPIWRKSADTI